MNAEHEPDPHESAANLNPFDNESIPAWEQIEAGRYMPRRIRGSFRGRNLG